MAGNDGEKVISGELADFAGEAGGAVGEENFGFAEATRVEQELTDAGMAGVILEGDAEIEVAQGYPGGFSTPTGMDQLVLKGQQLAECGTGERSILLFQAGNKGKLCANTDT